MTKSHHILVLSATLFSMGSSIPLLASETESFERLLGQAETVADNVSIATSYSQPIQAAPAVTTVITAQQIRETGARNLIEILEFVPGFFIGHIAVTTEPVIGVRGFTSSFNQTILILLDGIPQNEYVFGDRLTKMGIVPIDIIERIEIMRGPGSALYGADAYSAVINIVTQHTPPEKNQVVVGAGSQRTRNARLFGGGRTSGFNIVGALEFRQTDGDETYFATDVQTNLDALFGTHASLAPSWANTHQGQFGAHLNISNPDTTLTLRAAQQRDIGLNVGLGGAFDPFGHIDTTTLEGLLEKTVNGLNWTAKGSLNMSFLRYALNDIHYLPAGTFGLFPEGVIAHSKFDEDTTRAQGTWSYTGWPAHRLTLGTGLERSHVRTRLDQRNYSIIDGMVVPMGSLQDVDDAPTLGALSFSRDLLFGLVQDEWGFHPDWTLTWGIRLDHYNDFGTIFSPRLALVWDSSSYLTTKLLYGKGFRSPSLLDRDARHIPSVAGNADLNPEKLNSLELAFDYRPQAWLTTRLNLFYQRTEDQIRLQNDGGATSYPENVGQQKGRGLELETKWTISRRTELYGAYAYQKNTDETTGADAGYSPHHQILARLLHRVQPWQFSIQARYVGRRNRIKEDTLPGVNTYTLVDTFVRRQIIPDLDIGLHIWNLFDIDAEESRFGTAFPSDTPLPGRTFFFDMIARF